MALTSYEAMTGRSLPTGVTSVVQDQPGTYVTGGATGYTPYVPKTTTRKIPKYDSAGKLLGYTVEVVDEDGKVISSSFEAASVEAAAAGRTLAADTFANTFALAFGSEEAAKPYVKVLYGLVSNFYKTGSTMDEALNLALRQARVDKTIPEFTNRFKGIFALEDRLKAGEAITVPTIAEFIKSEQEAGDLLRQAGMPDLATQEFLGDVLGQGKSVAEIGRIISTAFNVIDNAPAALKETLSANYPTATRIGLAKALIGGEKGAAALQKEIQSYSIVSAANQMGLQQTYAQAEELAKQGIDYNAALTGFGTVATALPGYEKILEMEKGANVNTADAQASLQKAILEKNALEQQKINDAISRERLRFTGSSGLASSKSLASQARGAGLV